MTVPAEVTVVIPACNEGVTIAGLVRSVAQALPGAEIVVVDDGYDMVVGTRASGMHAGVFRLLANRIYNLLASWMSGVPIPDLTSGFRAAKADLFRQFLSLLPNGFSYPTTSTMAFLRAGYA